MFALTGMFAVCFVLMLKLDIDDLKSGKDSTKLCHHITKPLGCRVELVRPPGFIPSAS